MGEKELLFTAEQADEMWARIDKEPRVEHPSHTAKERTAPTPHVNHQARYRHMRRMARKAA